MKESIQIALSLVKSLYPKESKVLDDHDLHIHVPAGAVPKDGPSAGITLTTALCITSHREESQPGIWRDRPAPWRCRTDRRLPEKLMAAQRAGISKGRHHSC